MVDRKYGGGSTAQKLGYVLAEWIKNNVDRFDVFDLIYETGVKYDELKKHLDDCEAHGIIVAENRRYYKLIGWQSGFDLNDGESDETVQKPEETKAESKEERKNRLGAYADEIEQLRVSMNGPQPIQYFRALWYCVSNKTASMTTIARVLDVPFNAAYKILAWMERCDFIYKVETSVQRNVVLSVNTFEEMFGTMQEIEEYFGGNGNGVKTEEGDAVKEQKSENADKTQPAENTDEAKAAEETEQDTPTEESATVKFVDITQTEVYKQHMAIIGAKLRRALLLACRQAYLSKSENVCTEHVICGLTEGPCLANSLMYRNGMNVKKFRANMVGYAAEEGNGDGLSKPLVRALDDAVRLSVWLRGKEVPVTTDIFLAALLNRSDTNATPLIYKSGADKDRLELAVKEQCENNATGDE